MKSSYSVILFLTLTFIPITSQARSVSSIQLKTSNETLSLNRFKGQVLYIDFWASWCTPCKKSFPWLNQMQAKYARQGFKIIAVNLDEDAELAKRFLQHHPSKFLIGYDPEGAIASQLDVRGMPSSFLVDRNGNIVSSHIGFREKDTATLETQIKNLLNK